MSAIPHLFWRLGATLACLTPFGAAAAPDATETNLSWEKFVQNTVVQRDGSADIRTESVFLITENAGIARVAQIPLSYSASRESLQVVEAYTRKADGRKLPVAAAQIIDQAEQAAAGAPMFQDIRVTTIGFPGLEVGDRVAYTVRLKRSVPMYPGQFEEGVSPFYKKVKDFRVQYDLPQDMPLASDAVGFAATPPASANGRTVYRWRYVPGANTRAEASSVAYTDYGRRLFVSTFGSFAAMARAYDARAADNSAAAPEIAALAAAIVDGKADPRARAYAIYDWVRANIRYVALFVNAGGVVPHPAATVLANRYGDCKDHVALMEALLAAAGIDSTPALINAGAAYRLPAVPVTFNHVITFIPGLGLYLDSTAEDIAAGYLPPPDLDKDVLLTRTGTLAHTPALQTSTNVGRTVMRIQADGSASFVNTLTIGGGWAEPTRHLQRNLTQLQRDGTVGQILGARGQRGTGTLQVAEVAGSPDQVQLTFTGKIDSVAALPGPVGLDAASAFNGAVAPNVLAFALEKTRSLDFVCQYGDFDEEARFELAKELKVLAIPRPLEVRTPDLDYRADYAQQDGAVTVRRRLLVHHKNSVCTPADFATMRPALEKITRDLKAQIILQSL